MNKIDYYKDLDLAEIKITVSNWAEDFPIIKKIFLSRSKHRPKKYVIMAETYDSRDLEIIVESLDKFEDFSEYFSSIWYLEFFRRAMENEVYDDNDPQWFVRFKKDFLNYAEERFLNDWPGSSEQQLRSDLNKTCKTNIINQYPSWSFYSKTPEQELPKEIFQDSLELIYERKNAPIPDLFAKMGNDHKNKKTIFPCPPGTKWEKIEISVVDDETVKIKTPYDSGQFTYRELGMSFKNNANKPKKIWQILKLFAHYNGRLDSNIPEPAKRILYNDYRINYSEKLPDYTKRLNKHLQESFGIKDSIFIYHYNKHKAYITKIKFSDHRHIKFSEFNIEKTLHETEVKNIQNKQGIPDIKQFDG